MLEHLGNPPLPELGSDTTRGRHEQYADHERTIFQSSVAYGPTVDIRGDVAVVYGINDSLASRVDSWRSQGYQVHLMTGVAWGQYQDYLNGGWDGKDHTDEAQMNRDGEEVVHGPTVPYMCPGPDFGRYLAEGVLRACDAGVVAVHLEEPEFWAKGGYSEAFKRSWKEEYNEEWQAPDSSVDARWRANRLMYYLYRRALQQIFDAVQEWNGKKSKSVRCYVATHSLLNYATWKIVSPESSLAQLNGSDGFIAQVWTGTSREPNVYKGVRQERTFETAFLEYGIMQNLVRATGRGIWYLADPVEDKPTYTWYDYHDNYQSGLVASLLQPEVAQYEITPWPERVFGYPGHKSNYGGMHIPADYAQELQQVFNALKDMRQDTEPINAKAPTLGFVMSDSLMFQRGGPGESDENMGHVYGLAMPFVKRGVPIQPVQLENFKLDGYLDKITVLLMTYEGQKPLTPDVHPPIAKWVKNGGTLIFVDDNTDGFNSVREWWNEGKMSYKTPREHLFKELGLDAKASDSHTLRQSIGKGSVTYIQKSPSNLANSPTGSDQLYEAVLEATPGATWKPAGYLGLRRGHYIAIAGLDETNAPHTTLDGLFVDIFDPKLLVQRNVAVGPGSRHFLVDLNRFKSDVIASSCEVTDVKSEGDGWSCNVRGASGTQGVVLLHLPKRAVSAKVDGEKVQIQVDSELNMVWVRFENMAKERKVEVRYETKEVGEYIIVDKNASRE